MTPSINSNHTSYFNWLIPVSDNFISVLRGAYFHELAHAVAMKLLYKGVEPKINLSIMGGSTTPLFWDGRSLTYLGNLCGLQKSRAMVSGAGPFMDCLTDIALGLLALTVKTYSFKLFATVKIVQSFCVFANASYAFNCGLGVRGDYTVIKNHTGISPLIPAAALSVRLLFVVKSIFS